MINQGISISWKYCTEYIPLQFEEIADHRPITETIEVWRRTKRIRTYKVNSIWKTIGIGKAKIILIYSKDMHGEELDLTDSDYNTLWGTATIELDINNKTGCAKWVGEFTNKWDGDAEWTLIDSSLIKEVVKERVTRIKREQQQLRAALLAIDKKCAITGECLPEVLDAAHIIAANKGGCEVIGNAILLRTDLHRLLDAQKIAITESGEITFHESLPISYINLIAGKKIPDLVHDRILKAIIKANLI